MLVSNYVKLCLFLSVLALLVRASNYSCPTWYYYSNTTQRCECGTHEAISEWIICDQETLRVQILDGFCVTYSGQDGLFFAGECPFQYKFNKTNRLFSELPVNPNELDGLMCGPYNRKGLSCGKCLDGYGQGVYTLDKKCADCSKLSIASAICLYLLVDIVPITLLFFCIMFFRLNLTSGPMLGCLLFCQGFSFILEFDLLLYRCIDSQSSSLFNPVLKIALILIECWNLSLLKPVIPPFCLSEKLTGIHIHYLHSASMYYLIFLVTISFVAIDLHASNNRIICIVLKPFHFVLKRTNITPVTSGSVIHALATFLQLSSTRQLSLFNDMLEPSRIFTNNVSHPIYKTVLYNGPAIEYLSRTHILLMMGSLMQCILLVFLPSLLLFIYPTRVYRSISQFISIRKQLAITTFVESLNHPYKDGLDNTRDYRALAGFALLGVPFVSICFRVVYYSHYNWFLFCCHFFSFMAIVVLYTRPCKSTATSISLSFYFILIGMCGLVAYLCHYDERSSEETLQQMFTVIAISSQVPMAFWVLYKVLFTCKLLHRIQKLSHKACHEMNLFLERLYSKFVF